MKKVKATMTALAAMALLGISATAALARPHHPAMPPGAQSMPPMNQPASDQTAPNGQSLTPNNQMNLDQGPMVAQVMGIHIVPSILAQNVNFALSPWYMRSSARTANAQARIFSDRQGGIVGITLTALGLPNPETINPRFHNYVVWLLDTKTNEMKNIGVLDSYNGGKAVFGYEPDQTLVGYDRIVVTPEANFATAWPNGWQQLSADIPQTAMLPPGMTPGMRHPMMPMMPQDNTQPAP